MNLSRVVLAAMSAPLVSLSFAAHAAEPVVAEIGRLSVTTADLKGDSMRIPPDKVKEVLSKPENVSQLTSNIIIRRELAAEAEKAGMANDPAVQAAIRIAKDKILSDLLFARMDAANTPKPEVLDQLAQTNYNANKKRFEAPEETRARHILVKLDTPNAKTVASEILAQVKAGADFEKLAKEKSQDPGSAVRGGDLGYFSAGRMVPPFEAAAAKLQKPGDISDIVETQFGYHIIKLEDRRAGSVRPFAEVKDTLRQEAAAKAITDARLAEVEKIRNGVKFNEAAIKAFAATYK
jgi:peptidyl-prolyl cis-trans isomerase C